MKSQAKAKVSLRLEISPKEHGLLQSRLCSQFISYWDTLSLEEQETSICQQMEALSDDQRDAFMSLHNALPFDNAPEQYYGIFQTNCLPLDEKCDRVGIFLKACRVNNDCANNAFNNWNENIKRHTLHALRDIRAGEEITILYVSGLKTRKARQTIFQDSFGFTCSCRICSLPEPESQRRDELIENVVTMSEAGRLIGGIRPLEAMKSCRVLLMFYKSKKGQEDGEFALSCENTATFFIMYGDLARAHVFAKKAAAVFSTILGSDSPKAAESAAIALDPSRHPRYGFSMKWKSAVEDIPQGLGSSDFEYWLWGRQIPDGLAGFIVLPFQYQLTIIPGASSKKRHWYFLGQILRVEHLQHLVFLLRDMHGKERPLHFCTNEGGRELTTSQCQKGYTVAIIDAVQDAFKAGDSETQPGIRLEDMRMIKVHDDCSCAALLSAVTCPTFADS